MSECADLTSDQRNRDVIIIIYMRRDYYENDKKSLREQARDKYRNLFEEEEKNKKEYGKNRYHNMSEEKKMRLKEYQKIIERQKNLNTIMNKIVI